MAYFYIIVNLKNNSNNVDSQRRSKSATNPYLEAFILDVNLWIGKYVLAEKNKNKKTKHCLDISLIYN